MTFAYIHIINKYITLVQLELSYMLTLLTQINLLNKIRNKYIQSLQTIDRKTQYADMMITSLLNHVGLHQNNFPS